MNLKHIDEISTIGSDILASETFKKATNKQHHIGSTVAEHSLKVAEGCIKVSNLLNKIHIKIDKYALVRSSLLHDLSLCINNYTFGPHQAVFHSVDSIPIAEDIVDDINKVEKNIIASHMFPISPVLPKFKEAWAFQFVDKYIAIKEYFLRTRNCIEYNNIKLNIQNIDFSVLKKI